MSDVSDDRGQQAERLRDYFEAQLLFADTLARRTASPISDVCLRFTNLRRRFGLGRVEADTPSPDWSRYAAGLERCASGPDRLAWTLRFFVESLPEEDLLPRFGCFSYELQDAGQVIRIHFSNQDRDNDCGPLVLAKVHRRRSELQEMFGHVRSHHPDARRVRGGSWLYNLPAYRRLFPAEYGASAIEPDRVRLEGTSSWGQLLDFRGAVKPAVRQALLENVRLVDLDAPWKAFPLRALAVESAIEPFYRLYDG